MRKVILQMAVSLDGYVAGPDRDLSWIFPGIGEDLQKWIVESLRETDTQFIGGVNYSEQVQHWPTATGELADIVNGSTKIVFSSSLTEVDWVNARLAEGSPAEEIARLRREPGKHIYVSGGAGLAQSLSAEGLIDEYRLMVQPVVLGAGLPLFKAPVNLRLAGSQSFETGALVLTYERA